MTIFKLSQRPKENLLNLAEFYKESILQDAELAERLLSAQDPHSFAKLVFELGKQKGYDFTTKDVETLLVAAGESEDWRWFVVTDEFEFVDEEERSEIEEMEEDIIFYSSMMCLNSASKGVAQVR
jgi:hypothetical protein